ncbi:MAG: TetR family transcriptional regulator [Microbacteriaceae bacterium]
MVALTRDAKRARTAQRILEAARDQFATLGYEGATIRGIAASAGVDASLVMQHYGSKAALFGSAVQLPTGTGKMASDHLLDVLGVRLGELPPETRALVRSMLTVPEAADAMREYLDERVENLARSIDGDDAKLRALLTVSGILGLTITQHFLKLRAFEGAAPEELLDAARGWIASLADG